MPSSGRLVSNTEIYSTIRRLRYEYLPKPCGVGYCLNICLLIGALLKDEFATVNIRLVDGVAKGCFHTWMEVNGIQIDPALDCLGDPDVSEFVGFPNEPDYEVKQLDLFDVNEYFRDATLDELKRYIGNR